MKGHYHGGTLVISIDINHEKLAAGDGKHWLACEWCGELSKEEWAVVSYVCDACQKRIDAGQVLCSCYKCEEVTWCEEVPFHGYSEFLCEKCFRAAVFIGEVV